MPSHTYAGSGSHNVSLTVTDESANTASVTRKVTADDVGLNAHFRIKKDDTNNLKIWFNGDYSHDTAGNAVVYKQWTFGDGGTATEGTPPGGGHTVYAASPSIADINAAVSAAAPGDTVSVPAGSVTWSSTPTFSKPVSIVGAGQGNTNITMSGGSWCFAYQPTPGTSTMFRFSGFTFSTAGSSKTAFHLVNTGSTNAIRNVRLDHLTFNGVDANPIILIDGPVYGVCDNCTFSGGYAHADNYAQDSCTDWSGSAPAAIPGGVDNFYWEDNTYISTDCLSTGGHGGRYCYRHNTVDFQPATTGIYPVHDMHGNQPGGVIATRLCEIYNNTYNLRGHTCDLFDDRGGQAFFFNNTFTNVGSAYTQIREEYDNSITCSGAYQMQVLNTYYWSNTVNGSLIQPGDSHVDSPLAEGTNFWLHRTSGFNGTVGVGVGLLSARPSSGLTAGVGYWATDTQTLYRAVNATTWEVYYVPYTYPHPLTLV